MAPWKLPPRAKVFEAFTAVADGRVRLTGPGSATVVSSGGDKTYDVEWSDDGRTVSPTTTPRTGRVTSATPSSPSSWRAASCTPARTPSPPWPASPGTSSTQRYKRDYDAAVAHVLGELPDGDAVDVEREVDRVLADLAALDLQRGGRGRRPPAGKS